MEDPLDLACVQLSWVLQYANGVLQDIGPAIQSAFNNCVLTHSGSTLYVPPGNYNMQTWVNLSGGTKWAFQMDGVIYRTSKAAFRRYRKIVFHNVFWIGTTGGNMIAVTNANDFEFFSSNSAGAIQGYGYQCRNAG